jgi:GNAT superfamily N-acetyltransferase
MAIEVREARPEEYSTVGDLLYRAFAEYRSPDDHGFDEHLELIRDVAGRVDRTVVLVAVEDGAVLGSTTIELHGVVGDDDAELPAGVAFVRMVGVDPSARRRGVARLLMDEVLRRASEAGVRELRLRTSPAMKPAHRLYESMGFERSAEVDLPVSEDFTLWGYRLPLAGGPW